MDERDHQPSRPPVALALTVDPARPPAIGLWEWRPDAGTVFWSTSQHRLFGTDRAASGSLDEMFDARIHPDDRARVNRARWSALDRRGPMATDYRIVRGSDGETRFIHEVAEALDASDEAPRRVMGITIDITMSGRPPAEREVARLERELARSTEIAAEVQRVAHIGSWEWNLRTEDHRWSDEMLRILGIDPAGFVWTYDLFWDLVHPDDLARVKDVDATIGVDYEIEYRMIRPDGETRIIHERAGTQFDADGTPFRVVGTIADVTERRALEAGLRETASSLAEAQRMAHLGSWEMDLISGISVRSPEMYRLFLGREEPAEHVADFNDFIHPEDRPAIDAAYLTLIESDGAYSRQQYRVVRPTGEIRYVEEESHLIRDASGLAIRSSGTVRDVTDDRERLRLLDSAGRIAHVGSWELDIEADVLRGSNETQRIFGLDLGEQAFDRQAFWRLVHPDDIAAIDGALRATIDDDKVLNVRHRIVLANGEERIVRERAEVVRDLSGRALRVIGTVQDVTELMAAEERLHRTARNLADAQRVAGIGSYEYDVKSGRIESSDEVLRIWGPDLPAISEPAEFVAMIHPDDRERTIETTKRSLAEAGAFEIDFRIVRETETRTIHATGAVFLDSGSNPQRIVGTIADITARLEAEAERARLVSAINRTPAAIMVTDADSIIRSVNPAFTDLYGYGADEVVGIPARGLGAESRDAAFWEALFSTIEKTGEAWTGQIINRRRDDSLVEVEMTISAILDESGRISGFIEIARDLSRERELEAQLRQAEKMEAIGQLASGIAHDFGNLLQVLSSSATVLARRLGPADPAYREIERISTAVDHGQGLTRQLLVFSAQDRERNEIFNPVEVIEDQVALFESLVDDGVEFTFRETSRYLSIRGNPDTFRQVILNLVINARDATGPGDHIEVSVSAAPRRAAAQGARDGRFVCIEVRDTGSGIATAVRARVFEPFYSTKPSGQGTGLGLSIAYGIVVAAGGTIEFRPTTGGGATFRVFWPRVEVMSTGRRQPRGKGISSAAPTPGRVILFVDDNDDVREPISALLTQDGYDVIACASAEAAILEARRQAPDVLVTDVVLPGMSGPQLAERLRADAPALPVLFISGYAGDESARENLSGIHTRALGKPVRFEEIVANVNDLLGERTV
jgi:PAS domain S-box-containing protein